MAGHPDSYEALLRHGIDHSGELNRNEYRALLARVAAFGHLASREPRALAWLEQAAAQGMNHAERETRRIGGQQ